MRTVCKQVGWEGIDGIVNPIGRSGGLLLGWAEGVTVHQIKGSSFCIEVEFESVETKRKMWAVFIYTSNKEKERVEQ